MATDKANELQVRHEQAHVHCADRAIAALNLDHMEVECTQARQ